MKRTSDLRIVDITPLESPGALKDKLPMTPAAAATVVESRAAISDIITRRDRRLLAIVGPCSIHSEEVALEYARRLAELRRELIDRVYVVMRVYFEKPRTTVGWRGFIIDPHIDGSYDVPHGLEAARRLLLQITELGVPVATETLDPIVPQYLADLVSWSAVGARTTESQTHREMASGLSMPVGFKNSTDGNLQVAINGMVSARSPHHFLGIDADGRTGVVSTRGNPHVHLILRGGTSGPNYDTDSVNGAIALHKEVGIEPAIVIDCSHANSDKQFRHQEIVWDSVIEQRASGSREIVGAMLEGNLLEGKQAIPDDVSKLRYGVSITDACIGWDTTERLLTRTRIEVAGEALPR